MVVNHLTFQCVSVNFFSRRLKVAELFDVSAEIFRVQDFFVNSLRVHVNCHE